MKELQGSWTITALETEGETRDAALLGNSKIIIDGDRFTTVSMSAAYGGIFRVNEAVTPKTLDLLFTDGPHKGLTSLGIFKLRGNSWTICLGFAGRDRPTSFTTTAESGHALETLRRDKPGAKPAAASKPAKLSTASKSSKPATDAAPIAYPDEVARLGGEWTAVSITTGGQPLPTAYLPMAKRVATENEIVVSVAGQVQLHVSFTVDPTTNPKSLDYSAPGGSGKGATRLGIYELNDDLLTTLVMPAGKPRPTAFVTTAGDGATLSVWKRN